jgi:acetolactate synthase I/II/III large subunit
MPRYSGQRSTYKLLTGLPINQVEVTMKALEALADCAEGVDHVFVVMGDANQDIRVALFESTGSNPFTPITRLPPLAWATAMRVFPVRSALPVPRKVPATTNATTSLVLARLH